MHAYCDELIPGGVDDIILHDIINACHELILPTNSIFFAAVSTEKLLNATHDSQNDNFSQMFLTEDEQEHCKSFRYTKRKREWLGGRIAAKYAAEKFLAGDMPPLSKVNWRAWQVSPDIHGRPHIKSNTGLQSTLPGISISHSGSLAVAMAADNLCGIDIQKKSDTVIRVQDRFTDLEELEILTQAAALRSLDKKTHLTLLWTAKEAVRKTIPIAPLLGFKEMRLIRITGTGQKGYQLEFSVLPGSHRKTINSLPYEITTKATAFKNYALAFAIMPTLT